MITGKPYPIKGLIAYGVSLFHTLPNVPRTKEALKNLDFYLAVDTMPQDHIAWADVVLPEATYLERYDELLVVAHKTPYIAMREPAVEPYAQTKPAWWIVRELGLRLGLDSFFQWKTAQEYLNTRLSSLNLNLDKLRTQGGVAVQKGKPWLADFEAQDTSPFATESGKVELFAASLEKAKLNPLPDYEPTPEPPQGFFRLTYGRSPVHTFSRTTNAPLLYELFPENEIWINADVAAQLGVKTGDRVMLENQDKARSGPIRVKATQRIRKDCVFMVHGFGHNAPGMTRANQRGASDTALQTKYVLDPVCGGAGLRVNFVKLLKEGQA